MNHVCLLGTIEAVSGNLRHVNDGKVIPFVCAPVIVSPLFPPLFWGFFGGAFLSYGER